MFVSSQLAEFVAAYCFQLVCGTDKVNYRRSFQIDLLHPITLSYSCYRPIIMRFLAFINSYKLSRSASTIFSTSSINASKLLSFINLLGAPILSSSAFTSVICYKKEFISPWMSASVHPSFFIYSMSFLNLLIHQGQNLLTWLLLN